MWIPRLKIKQPIKPPPHQLKDPISLVGQRLIDWAAYIFGEISG